MANMEKMIERCRKESVESLMATCALLFDSSGTHDSVARMACMVALEEKIGTDAFNQFYDALDADEDTFA